METLSEHLPQLLLGWSIQWMGVLSPGPGVALIMAVATSRGRGPAVMTCLGIGMGAVVLSIATVLGIAALFSQMADLMMIVRFIGAAYLLYLAYKSFRTAILLPPLNLQAAPVSRHRTAAAGFFMQISNPKAIFFWLAVAAAGGVGNAPLPIIVLFVTGAFFNSFVGHSAYALLLSSAPFRAGYVRARRWVEGTLGIFFTLFAFKLATDRS